MDVKIPDKMSEDLAYICGVLVGDGNLTLIRNGKNRYQLSCVGHPIDEKEFYDKVISSKLKEVFDISVEMKSHDHGTTYGFKLNSKPLLIFLSEVIGIPTGNKSGLVTIPEIFNKSERLKTAFIRGHADTDFCLTLKKRYRKIHYYPVIVGVSKSRKIMEQTIEHLEAMGFTVSKDFNRRFYDVRTGKTYTTHRFQLYGHKQLILWMKRIGFENPKHFKKYQIWKKLNSKHGWKSVRRIAGDGFEPSTLPGR